MSHPPGHASAEGFLSTTAPGLLLFRKWVDHARAAYDTVIASNGEAAEAGAHSVCHDDFAYEQNPRPMHQLGRRVRDLTEALRQMHVVTGPGRDCAIPAPSLNHRFFLPRGTSGEIPSRRLDLPSPFQGTNRCFRSSRPWAS
jgi:hypothetical protein